MLWSCREIQPFGEQLGPISGYQVKGNVTTQNGIPLDSVVIEVSYSADVISSTPLDTVSVIITDSIRTVYVAVYTPSDQFVKQLFFGTRRPGILPRFRWDERDEYNALVPSGMYLIRYVYDTTIVKEVPYIAEGNPTATTNANGEFTIGAESLPVGAVFDYYASDNSYAGSYIVRPGILLRLIRGSRTATYIISLNKDVVTRAAFTL